MQTYYIFDRKSLDVFFVFRYSMFLTFKDKKKTKIFKLKCKTYSLYRQFPKYSRLAATPAVLLV